MSRSTLDRFEILDLCDYISKYVVDETRSADEDKVKLARFLSGSVYAVDVKWDFRSLKEGLYIMVVQGPTPFRRSGFRYVRESDQMAAFHEFERSFAETDD